MNLGSIFFWVRDWCNFIIFYVYFWTNVHDFRWDQGLGTTLQFLGKCLKWIFGKYFGKLFLQIQSSFNVCSIWVHSKWHNHVLKLIICESTIWGSAKTLLMRQKNKVDHFASLRQPHPANAPAGGTVKIQRWICRGRGWLEATFLAVVRGKGTGVTFKKKSSREKWFLQN